MLNNKIMMSVDMDEWYQCRWATGSQYAIWPDTKTCFKEYYYSDKPVGEIKEHTKRLLKLFSKNQIRATFFFTGEIANYYPELVEKIVTEGHEIGSHNYVHKDYTGKNKEEFSKNLKKSKRLLERISKQKIIGYRAPNSTVDNYMIKELIRKGFKYDSSVTPTRPFMGKFGKFTYAPKNPYQLSYNDFAKKGNSGLWEFPWPVFPVLSLPSGSGIMSRIAGYNYTILSFKNALKTGDTVYYFHPYEIGNPPDIKIPNLKTRIFMRRMGENYFFMLQKIIKRYKGSFICGEELLERNLSNG